MSALSDYYIYDTYQQYESGARLDKQSSLKPLKVSEAASSYKMALRKIKQEITKHSNTTRAKQIQELLNYSTYGERGETIDNLGEAQQEALKNEKIIAQINESLGAEMVTKNLGVQSAAAQAQIERAIQNIKKSLETTCQNQRVILKSLKKLRKLAVKNKETIEKTLNQSTTKTPEGSLTDKRIASLTQAINTLKKSRKEHVGSAKRFLQKVNNKASTKSPLISSSGKTGSSLLTDIRDLYNSLLIIPAWNTGEVGELGVYYVLRAASGAAEGAVRKEGDRRGSQIKKLKDIGGDVSQYNKDDITTIGAKGEEVIIFQKKASQDRVDISFNFPDSESEETISVKNYDASQSQIHILNGGVLYNLVEAENQEGFVSHYLNIQKLSQGADGKNVKRNSYAIEQVMNKVMLAKALFAYDIFKGYDNQILPMKEVDYFTINLRKGDKDGSWYVYAMGDLYKKALNNKAYVVHNKLTNQDTTNPFLGVQAKKLLKDYDLNVKDSQQRAINYTHQSKIDVYLKSSLIKGMQQTI